MSFSEQFLTYPSHLSVVATGSVTLLYTILFSTVLFFVNIPFLLYTLIKHVIQIITKKPLVTAPKTVFITGGSTGIGQALALEYISKGSQTVYITGRKISSLQETIDKSNKIVSQTKLPNAKCIPIELDVTDEQGMRDKLQSIDTETNIDLIIANAGISPEQQKHKKQENILRDTYQTNITGVLNTIFPLYDRFIERRHGHFVLISSIASFGNIAHPAYSSSKALITTLGQGLRRDLSEFNVNVSVVCPGFIRTNMTKERHEQRANGLPFYQEVDASAEVIYNGVAQNIDVIVFPFPLAVLSWALRFIPMYMFDAIALLLAKQVYRAPTQQNDEKKQ